MRYEVYTTCVKIFDSWDISKHGFSLALGQIRAEHPGLPLWENRSTRSMKCEWATHNLLYSLGKYRSRTKDVDINFSHKWYVNLAYWLAGTIALAVIK